MVTISYASPNFKRCLWFSDSEPTKTLSPISWNCSRSLDDQNGIGALIRNRVLSPSNHLTLSLNLSLFWSSGPMWIFLIEDRPHLHTKLPYRQTRLIFSIWPQQAIETWSIQILNSSGQNRGLLPYHSKPMGQIAVGLLSHSPQFHVLFALSPNQRDGVPLF